MNRTHRTAVDRIARSIRHRAAYQVSGPLAHVLSRMKVGKYGHGPRLTHADPLLDMGIHVESITIDIEDVRQFWHGLCDQSERLWGLMNTEPFWNKSSEYYISFKAIQDIVENPEAVQVDIAGTANSPYQDILGLLAKTANLYVQDLVFPAGINGHLIGGSADNLPLPDASVSSLTLHCSFEHFEADADTGFVREAGRVLQPGGKVCIVPLYLGEYPFILSDPAWGLNVTGDKDTVIHYFPKWGERHGRFYSARTLVNRIIEPARDVGLTAKALH